MEGTFEEFLDALLAYESGWDRERYDAGIIQDWQLTEWAGGSVQDFFPQYDSWSDLTDAEWEAMAYRSMNSYGFVGYQFGEALLIDLGYYDDDFYYGNGAATNTWDGTWTGKNGVTSLEDFMTQEAQDVAIREAFGHNLGIIEDGLAAQGYSIDDFIGTTISYTSDGTPVPVTVSLTGILASAHLRGAPAVVELLLNGTLSNDEYGTSILQYMEQFGGFESPGAEELIAYFEDRLTGDEGLGSPGDPVSGGSDGNGTAEVDADTADVVIDWAWGTDAVETGFDPASDTIYIGWFTADHISVSENNGNVVFSIPSNNQSATLQGISLSELSAANFTIMDSTAAQEILALVGQDTGGDTDIGTDGDTGGDTDGGTGGDTGDNGGGDDGSGDGTNGDTGSGPDTGTGSGSVNYGNGTASVTALTATVAIDWAWGNHTVETGFDPASDTIYIGWFTADHIDVSESGGDVIFSIPSNNQSLTLTGVSLSDLSNANFTIMDNGAASEILSYVTDVGEGIGNVPYDSDGSNPPATNGTTDQGGVKYVADWSADDVTGFDVSRDALDFGDTSVHGMIITKLPSGELAIDNPWGDDMQILQGIDYSQLSIENFGIVGNEHLRQDIGGVLSWELGVGPRESDTVYIRSHEYGVHEVIDDFDPATMKISFLYYGTRERLTVEDTADGLVISTEPSGQSFTFTGVSLSDLQPNTLEFHHDQVMEDNLEAPFGFSQNDVSLVSREEQLTPEAPTEATTDGNQVREGTTTSATPVDGDDDGDDHSDHMTGSDEGGTESQTDAADETGQDSDGSGASNGETDIVRIGWSWGREEIVSGFAPEEDVIDFGALSSGAFAITEVDEDLHIEVLNNGGHKYILQNVKAEDLTLSNLSAPDWNDDVLNGRDGVIDQLSVLGNEELA